MIILILKMKPETWAKTKEQVQIEYILLLSGCKKDEYYLHLFDI